MSGCWESKHPPTVGMEGRTERQRWESALAFTDETQSGGFKLACKEEVAPSLALSWPFHRWEGCTMIKRRHH